MCESLTFNREILKTSVFQTLNVPIHFDGMEVAMSPNQRGTPKRMGEYVIYVNLNYQLA